MAFLGSDTTARSVNEFLFDSQGRAVPRYGGIMVRVMSRRGGRVRLWDGAALARLVRREGGMPAVTDGPYLETKEYIASFYLLDCESEERALAIAADMPWADQEPVELWPILHEAKSDL